MAISFLKKGAESANLAKQEEAEKQKQKEEQGKMFRFLLKDKEEARVTFVDGELSSDGFLIPPRFYEHHLQLGGKWGNYFLCPEKTNPESGEKCPICAGSATMQGDRPALVALFTVIDHRTWESKDKTKSGKDSKRLYVAKAQTFEQLSKLAIKRGGLAGCTFDISRIGDKAAGVGSMFDFVEKNDIGTLQKKYTIEVVDPKTNVKTIVTNFTPANYEFEITNRTADDLRKLGFGSANITQISNIDMSGQESSASGTNYSDHL